MPTKSFADVFLQHTNKSTMPVKGQIAANPFTGDSSEFIETAADSNGMRVTTKDILTTKGKQLPTHIHQQQDETFEMLTGELTVEMNGKTWVIGAGKKITFPKGTPHNHYNATNDPITYIHTMTPALDFDYVIENLKGLDADGKSKNGRYGFLQEMVVLNDFESKTYLATLPAGLQKLTATLIAPIGRLLGYKAIYKKYSGVEKK